MMGQHNGSMGIESIPFTLTIKGTLTVPTGTPKDQLQAAVLGQVTIAIPIASALTSVGVDFSGLSIAKG